MTRNPKSFTRGGEDREEGAESSDQQSHEQVMDEIERQRAELQAFACAVTHEFRTPLRHVEAFAQLLRQRAGRWDEESQRYLDALLHGVEEMRGLLDALLRLCRVSNVALRRQPVDLSVVAHAVVAGLRRQAPHRQVSVRIEPGIRVIGDPELLEVALRNLLENAWKFTRGRSKAQIEVGLLPAAEPPTFFVRDNGLGFPAERVEEMFRPLARLHPRHEFEGLGFGLAIVARIVERHGGRVWAEGEVGGGATFYVALPELTPENSTVGK